MVLPEKMQLKHKTMHVYGTKPHLGRLGQRSSVARSSAPVMCAANLGCGVSLNRRSLGFGMGLIAPLSWTSMGIADEEPGAVLEQKDTSLGFEDRVSEFTLPNGLHFIVLERHTAPVVSCHIHANVGAFDEVDGQTVFYQLRDAKTQGQVQKAQQLEQLLRDLQGQAEQLVIPNAYGALLQQQGAVGLNASTSHDSTVYFTSLPSNKLELWFALEAERFQAPVFRELYSEKRVVLEERAMRVDNAPNGRWQEAFAGLALANNYRRPVIGYADDISSLGRREVSDFFSRYYAPANLTISVVGDTTPEQVQQFAEKYFGSWQPSNFVALPRPSATEPLPKPQAFLDGSCSQYSAPSKAGPVVMLGYYRPPLTTDEGIILEVLADILAGSRTSRLISNLVQKDRAVAATCITGYPGEKHSGMTLIYGVPPPGDSVEGMSALLKDELQRLSSDGVSPAELQRVKKNTKALLLSTMQSNRSMATALASYHAQLGSWRSLVRELEVVQALTAVQVQSVAQNIFTDDNCFTGYVLPMKA